MNQMYLNDIDLMKFEHIIHSDLDMFMIECYEDYYTESEGTKEGIFQKIKRKIKEIFDKLKAIFRGKKVKQMNDNIKEAQEAVQQFTSEQKRKSVEVFDGEKALKLIEEDHEKAKKDPNHKRLDKKKIIALCTIPVTIGVAITILIKNKKALPKILDKEQELNKEVEQAEKQAKKAEDEKQNEERKNMATYKKYRNTVRSLGCSPNRGINGHCGPYDDSEGRNADTIDIIPEHIKLKGDRVESAFNVAHTDHVIFSQKLFSDTLQQFVGLYTVIIDKNTKQAKEIIDYHNPELRKDRAYITDVEIKKTKKNKIDSVSYNSKLLRKDITINQYYNPGE